MTAVEERPVAEATPEFEALAERQERAWHSEDNMQRRRAKLVKRMERYTTILSEEARAVTDKMAWNLPMAGDALMRGESSDDTPAPIQPRRRIEECCAICLCGFESGDEVSWSSNADCHHVFHTECIQSWLLRRTAFHTKSCPCCRQRFVVKKKEP